MCDDLHKYYGETIACFYTFILIFLLYIIFNLNVCKKITIIMYKINTN